LQRASLFSLKCLIQTGVFPSPKPLKIEPNGLWQLYNRKAAIQTIIYDSKATKLRASHFWRIVRFQQHHIGLRVGIHADSLAY
jgi:predicted nuclease of restriction endonuclease-like RecB superfamily